MPRRLSVEQLAEVEVRLTRGYSLRRIVRETGVTLPAIKRNFPEHKTSGSGHLSPELAARMQAMIEDGASFSEIARTLGCGRNAVAYRFPGRGWSASEGGKLSVQLRKFQKGGL